MYTHVYKIKFVIILFFFLIDLHTCNRFRSLISISGPLNSCSREIIKRNMYAFNEKWKKWERETANGFIWKSCGTEKC